MAASLRVTEDAIDPIVSLVGKFLSSGNVENMHAEGGHFVRPPNPKLREFDSLRACLEIGRSMPDLGDPLHRGLPPETCKSDF